MIGGSKFDTTCKEIVCEKVNDPKGIIDCSAELDTTGKPGQVYDIYIMFNKRIDNMDFEEDKYVFEISAKVFLFISQPLPLPPTILGPRRPLRRSE